MKKKVDAIIDNAKKCPYFGCKLPQIIRIIVVIFGIRIKPKCYHPATSKPGWIRECNCRYDKDTDKYLIRDGCPLETVIDEETVKAVLKQQNIKKGDSEPEEGESE